MLSLLAIHIVITFVCISAGFYFNNVIFKKERESIIFSAITGLIFLTIISQIAILFTRLSVSFQILLLALCLLVTFITRRKFLKFLRDCLNEITTLSLQSRVLFLVVWLVVLLINSGPTIMDDTESYHIQSIKWIQEYGTVPGLVNLHERYGFNSSWFSSIALFCFSNKFSGGFTLLNSVLSVWLSYWLISKFDLLQKENNIPSTLAILFCFIVCLLVWPLIRGNSATTNYDFITTFAVLVLFTELILSKEKDIPISTECIIWPAYLFTVRIINFPLFLLTLFGVIFLIRQKKYRTIFPSILCCILLIVPFIVRNVIVTGFPFYPATTFDWFNVDWKPDPRLTKTLLEYIKYFNRVATTYLDIEQTKALGSGWIPSWFRYLFIFDKAIMILGLAGLVLTGLKLAITPTKYNRKLILALTISFAWLICWFLIAPDPRFVYGVLLWGIFLFFYEFISVLKNVEKLKALLNIAVIVLITGSGIYFISKIWKQDEYRNWILPAKLPKPPTQQFIIDGIIFHIPERINNNWNPRCFGTELPCLYNIHPRLRARGKSIRSGFHLEK